MQNTALKFKRLPHLFEFIRDYKLTIPSNKRFRGIVYTLFGWGLIAINTVLFQPTQNNLISTEVYFLILFISSCLSILFYVIIESLTKGGLKNGFNYLLIKKDDENAIDPSHLAPRQRLHWIYFRGLIATGGYIAFSISKTYFGIIDNSEIFGADALIFAILASIILHQRFSLKEWLGIALACFGVFFIFFFDITSWSWKDGLISSIAGILSALALTVIFFITGIIVRHDTPKRVAFHQCVAGIFVASLVILFTIILEPNSSYSIYTNTLTKELVKNAIISGIFYAAALVFFLRAFLYTEPIIIAVLGYSLGIFVITLEWFISNSFPGARDVISSILISTGCIFLIYEEYKKDKNRPRALFFVKPTYHRSLRRELALLRRQFHEKSLDRYSYLSEKHEFNKILLEYSSQIKHLPIENIQIVPDSLLFKFKPLGIELETDGGARSAPFEILNFGYYEPEEESIAYKIIQNGNTILDLGAHIGWYTVNLAVRFPQSQVIAFEPVGHTFNVLKRNIERNHLTNVTLSQCGLLNQEKIKAMYYFPGGSAVASIENLLDHQNASKIQCEFTTLDQVIKKLPIKTVDFIKCDVEGSELFVLQGGKHVIEQFKPIILIEIYEEWCKKCGYKGYEIVQFLKQLGYEIYQAFHHGLVKITSTHLDDKERYNYFFLHTENHKHLIQKFTNYAPPNN
jgi:FkbM family methyltransferase